jgi:uncharacterized membrane protein
MRTTASASSLPQDSYNYSPEELESMRQAFRRACDENPSITTTAEQRYGLAQAIVNRFQRNLSETELIAAALGQAH